MPGFLSPTFIIAILVALSIHEWAHAYVAWKLGDPTAKYDGRLTINPLAHLDPIGTILFIFVGFGWGKPVPVNPQYFKHYKRDNALVALAGPVSNLIVAFAAFAILLVMPTSEAVWAQVLNTLMSDIIKINLVLMAFNLLPIAPLDGSKILDMFIPYQYQRQYAEFMMRGPFILLALILLGRAFGVPLLSGWISLIISPILVTMGVIASLL